jgi:hypothetical protein
MLVLEVHNCNYFCCQAAAAAASDTGVFKCMEITVEDDIIVVYRSKYNTRTKKWGKVNLKDPIHVDDIQKCHRNKKFIKIMNSILFSK